MVVDGRRVPNDDRALERYVADVLVVREAFAPQGLWVGLGLEVDYFPGVADFVAESLARYPFDFVIGSVHCLDHRNLSTPEEAPACFDGLSLPDMARRYFDLVAEAAATALFDVIGHLDIYKLYGHAVYGDDVLTAHRDLAEPALQAMARHSVGLEVNTAAWRKGCAEPYPGAELLALARAAGVAVLTFGSDAHRLADLGRDLELAVAYTVRAGYTAVHRFRHRRAVAAVPLKL
jgi:histidinol-phosphatase (PHP family)